MTGQQRVTDEQLTALAARYDNEPWLCCDGFTVRDLIAELRASRADVERLSGNLSVHYMQLRHAYREGYDKASTDGKWSAGFDMTVDGLRAERDGLQQRIDKALAEITAERALRLPAEPQARFCDELTDTLTGDGS